jgi:hypothetical protein
MYKTIQVTLTTLLLSVTALACPGLEGNFTYSGKSIISISQANDKAGVTSYKVTIDDGNCAACHIDWYLIADGVVKEKTYDRAKEVTNVFCENNRLKFRQKTEYFNDEGLVVFTENIQQDYRINAANNLAIENIENDIPVSKVVYPRISF